LVLGRAYNLISQHWVSVIQKAKLYPEKIKSVKEVYEGNTLKEGQRTFSVKIEKDEEFWIIVKPELCPLGPDGAPRCDGIVIA